MRYTPGEIAVIETMLPYATHADIAKALDRSTQGVRDYIQRNGMKRSAKSKSLIYKTGWVKRKARQQEARC